MKNTMKQLFITIGLSVMLAGVLSAQTQIMSIHIGSTVQQFDLAVVDSITFTEGNDDPPAGFVQVPAGTFMMGHSSYGAPVHQVTLTRDFYLGQHEVTNKEYVAVLQWAYDNNLLDYVTSTTVHAFGQEILDLDGETWGPCQIEWDGSEFIIVPVRHGTYEGQSAYDHPVMDVTWYGAACYCDWLSMMNGETPFYNGDWSVSESHNPYTASVFRLPTEAEWEYANRYPDNRTYPWGNTSPTACVQPNFQNCIDWTSPYGTFPAGDSELGLQDMAGNVWDWVNDYSGSYSSSPQVDPLGASSGSRQCRGGSWNDYYNSRMNAAFRYARSASYSSVGIGFRGALTVPQ